MYDNTPRQTELVGMALCLVKIGYKTEVVSTRITCPAIYTPDWQCEVANWWHDEGSFDYDMSEAKSVDPTDYVIIDVDGDVKEGKEPITEILQVLKEDTNEA
jgi:hypothetical protein